MFLTSGKLWCNSYKLHFMIIIRFNNYNNYTLTNVQVNRARRQCGGGCLMVWGMVMPNGIISIHILEEEFNGDKYIGMLRDSVIPLINLNCKKCYFLQDNCRVHIAKHFQCFLSKKY